MMSLKNYLRKSILVGVKMIEDYAIPYFKAILKADQDKDKPMRKLWDDDVKKIESYIISYGNNSTLDIYLSSIENLICLCWSN